MWSWFSCWRSLGLLQSLYWWCLFPCKFLFWGKYTHSMLSPIVFVLLHICWFLFAGHAECVRFVKRFNLPLLVGVYHFMFSFLYLSAWYLHKWTSAAGSWRWGIHQRKCCSMLDTWNWSSSRYRASKWYIKSVFTNVNLWRVLPFFLSF